MLTWVSGRTVAWGCEAGRSRDTPAVGERGPARLPSTQLSILPYRREPPRRRPHGPTPADRARSTRRPAYGPRLHPPTGRIRTARTRPGQPRRARSEGDRDGAEDDRSAWTAPERAERGQTGPTRTGKAGRTGRAPTRQPTSKKPKEPKRPRRRRRERSAEAGPPRIGGPEAPRREPVRPGAPAPGQPNTPQRSIRAVDRPCRSALPTRAVDRSGRTRCPHSRRPAPHATRS